MLVKLGCHSKQTALHFVWRRIFPFLAPQQIYFSATPSLKSIVLTSPNEPNSELFQPIYCRVLIKCCFERMLEHILTLSKNVP